MTDDNNGTVLIIEDDPAFRRFLRNTLVVQRYDVIEAETGQQGLGAVAHAAPGLVMLDLGLPDMDGMEVIRLIRTFSEVPILVVSSRSDEAAKVMALDLGASDYVSKPCTVEELTARIRTASRHTSIDEEDAASAVFANGGLTVDVTRGVVTVEGREIELSGQEFDILREFVLHPGRALTHRHLLRAAWGSETAGDVQHLRACIRQIREKIEPSPAKPTHIVTEPGIGYRLHILNEPP